MTESSETHQDLDSIAREERLDEEAAKLGNYTLARERLGIQTESDEDTPRAAKKAPRKPRHSRRGGRSFPEPSDSELDPHYKITVAQQDPGQRTINERGRKLVAKTLEEAQKPVDAPPHDPEEMRRQARESWRL